jgi:hypothetical protein
MNIIFFIFFHIYVKHLLYINYVGFKNIWEILPLISISLIKKNVTKDWSCLLIVLNNKKFFLHIHVLIDVK